jgi:Ion channel
MSEVVVADAAAPVQVKTLPYRAIFLVIAFAVLIPLDLFLSDKATVSGGCYSGLLIIASLLFLAVGAVIAMQPKPDAGPPPWLLIVTAILLETVKTSLLWWIPAPHDGMTAARGNALSTVSLVFATITCLATLGLAALVADSLHTKTEEWDKAMRALFGKISPVVKWLNARQGTALCCGFASFLLAASFLTFAVAFDDRQEKSGSLYQVIPKSAQSAPPARGDFIRFYFLQSSADLNEYLPLWKTASGSCENIEKPDVAAGMVNEYCGSSKRWDTEKRAAAARNLMAYCKARKWFESDADYRIQLVILGHANPEAYRGAHPSYDSNAELAYSRAEQTRLVLNSIADDAEQATGRSVHGRLQFDVLGGASERAKLDLSAAAPEHLDLFTSAEVEHQVIRDGSFARQAGPTKETSRLDLLDYCYFMTYTVTTTGYGDLIPVTPRTKFAVSLANLIEVIYLRPHRHETIVAVDG